MKTASTSASTQASTGTSRAEGTGRLQVLLSFGAKDLARAELALQTALAAASCGTRVNLFLTQAGSLWGCRAPLEGEAARLAALVDALLALEVEIECCSVCAETVCGPTDPVNEWGGLREGVVPTGLVTFAARAARGVPTVTF